MENFRITNEAKKLLLNQESIEVYSGTYGAQTVAQACEQLVRLGYVSVEDVRSETNIIEGSRRIKFVIGQQFDPVSFDFADSLVGDITALSSYLKEQ